MNSKIFLIAIILTTFSCTSSSSENSADSLMNCMTSEDVLILQEACKRFEVQLLARYDGQDKNQAYLDFLFDIQAMNISPEFFKTKDSWEMIAKFKETQTFDKIWIRPTPDEDLEVMVVQPNEREQNQMQLEPFSINTLGTYLDCISKHNDNTTIADYLEAIKAVPGLSPGLTAGVLTENLSTSDLDSELTRIIIAIGFYYEIALLFNEE